MGLEAAVEDADEAVADLAECGLVLDVAVAEGVVVGADFGIVQHRGAGLHVQGVDEAVVVDEPGVDGLRFPGLAGQWCGSGIVLPGFRVGVTAGGVPELGEHPGAEDSPDTGLAEIDLSVWVPAKMLLDLPSRVFLISVLRVCRTATVARTEAA